MREKGVPLHVTVSKQTYEAIQSCDESEESFEISKTKQAKWILNAFGPLIPCVFSDEAIYVLRCFRKFAPKWIEHYRAVEGPAFKKSLIDQRLEAIARREIVMRKIDSRKEEPPRKVFGKTIIGPWRGSGTSAAS